jgi:O-antigen ligase
VREQAITIILAGSALVALGLLVPAVKRARTAGDLDASTALTLALGWLVSLPIVVVTFSGGLVRRLDSARELVPVLPSWYEPAAYLSLALVIALAAVLLVKRLVSETRRVTVHTAGLIAILLWAVAWLASGLQGGPLLSLSGATLLACLLAATVLPRGRGACVGAGLFGVTIAAASGLLAAVRFDIASVECRDDCVLGSALTGVFANENLLGTALVAALPFAYLGFRGRTRIWLVAYVAGMAFATGSRGAMLAVVILVAALLVVRPRLDADRPTPVRTAIAGLLLVAALLGSLYIGQHHWSSSTNSLDDRPLLWTVASEYRQQAPLFGYGPEKWETLYTQTGEIPRTAQHSTHNQWVDVVFIAGWVGAALLLTMMVAMLWSAGPARPAVLIVLATVFMIGTTERAWLIGAADFVSFSLVALLLLGPTGAEIRAGAVPGVRAEPSRARHPRRLAVPSG